MDNLIVGVRVEDADWEALRRYQESGECSQVRGVFDRFVRELLSKAPPLRFELRLSTSEVLGMKTGHLSVSGALYEMALHAKDCPLAIRSSKWRGCIWAEDGGFVVAVMEGVR